MAWRVDELDRRLRKRARPEKLLKDSELFETVEEVFDAPTLMNLYELMRRSVIKRMGGVVSSGKEARVYRALSPDGKYLAVKIYLTSTSEFKKSIWRYIVGDPRFEGVDLGDTRKLIYAWARKEYRNLKRLYEASVRVPKPIAFRGNVVVMEFIGDDGVRAPLLKEAFERGELTEEELDEIFRHLVSYVEAMYCRARIVHADLSEYNVMLWNGEVVVIDVAQAVDLAHPMSWEFLVRDVRNIVRFFREEAGLDVDPPERILERVRACRGLS